MTPPPPKALLTTRTAVVLLLGASSGTAAGLLTALACHNVPTAVLAGLGAAGAATAFFHNHIADDPPEGSHTRDREPVSPTTQTAHVIQNFDHNDQRRSHISDSGRPDPASGNPGSRG
ncbi:hypothetical protein SUDANB95_01980 [Actinosynnema sp. ALI-1.44]